MLLYRRARIRPGTAGIGSLSKHQPHSLPIRKERINPQMTQMYPFGARRLWSNTTKNPKKIICENLCNLRTKNLLRCFPLPPLFQICPPVEISGKKRYIIITGESVDCAPIPRTRGPCPARRAVGLEFSPHSPYISLPFRTFAKPERRPETTNLITLQHSPECE